MKIYRSCRQASRSRTRGIGVNAYLYFDPLVTMDETRRHLTNVWFGKESGKGPVNTFANGTPDSRLIGRAGNPLWAQV
jgi:hypothetical protein